MGNMQNYTTVDLKGVFDWTLSHNRNKQNKNLFNLVGHNSCQVRIKTQPSYISRPSHYL